MWRVPAGRCGVIDAAKYKETILPLLFYKRLSDVYVDEIAKENPDLKEVIDISDYNDTTAGQRILPDGQLAERIDVLSRYRLGLHDVKPVLPLEEARAEPDADLQGVLAQLGFEGWHRM